MYDDILEISNPFDEVLPGLFMGGSLPNYRQFDSVVCLVPNEIHLSRNGQMVLLAPFDDSRVLPSDEFLRGVVALVLQRLQRGSVMVHCSAGCNRSGLIVGLVMVSLGYSPQLAIWRMREVRSCSVLHNTYFEDYLLSQARSLAGLFQFV